ncbi:MAG: AAA family ATPase, partial [Chloroflexota bacterium]|nr:AAA family ATPase [Chloroflexota bacterium]
MTDPHAGARLWTALHDNVGRAVVGADEPLRLMTVALLAEGHALLEDVPGVGKTLLARAFARSLGLSFARVQGTPDLLPTDVTGSSVLAGGSFRFIPGPIFTNVLLVDEINRATPRTQSALLEAMQERQVSVDGETRPIPSPFLVLATQNPIELEGTFALPEAQLDRFLVRIALGYPGEDDERAIARRYRATEEPLEALDPVLDTAALPRLRDAARTATVSDEVEAYIVRLVRATREHTDLQLGASPRASV